MSAKLIVHRFDSCSHWKSLEITIEDVENSSSESRFGDWTEPQGHQAKVSKAEKSARLVVKIASDDEVNNLDLDVCAEEVDTEAQNVYTNCETFRDNMNSINNDIKIKSVKVINASVHNRLQDHSLPNEKASEDESLEEHISPLEYSLEKIKENNARIMENIHMLNRTLSYTKNKEMYDVVCPKSMRSYSCTICRKCFVYETGLKRHYSMRHSMTEMQPRWQVVWTCIECFQVWPRQDIAENHMSDYCNIENKNRIREIKTSSLLQCEFCEKVYTSIPRLLRHSKIHTTLQNYQCNACEAGFNSYKVAERHWQACPWQKICYSFALPKMLLCNACDRKFRNYEQLYNHRYKLGHFMTKMFGNGNLHKHGTFVYQCELCGQSFHSIVTLQEHRNQFHRTDVGVHSQIADIINGKHDY